MTPPPVFVMYYTATERSTGDQCIGMATAATPFGPYQDTSHNRLCATTTGVEHRRRNFGGSIDPDIFTDPTTRRLIPALEERRQPPRPARQHDHLVGTALAEPEERSPAIAVMLMHDDESWQSGIVEGPDMYDNQVTQGSGSNATTTDNYYLFYAGSDEGANTYAIGWATCPGPQGPCLDSPTDNPLLTTQPGMSGPGGPDIYTLPPRRAILGPGGDGLRRLGGHHHRIPAVRHQAHVLG